jgi:signal transduction histidine kinase/CheY-like chemotaxis protein
MPAVERTTPAGERAAVSGWLPGSPRVDRVVEAVLVLLVAASALRYLVRHPWSATSAAVVVGAAVLAAGYAAGRRVPARHRRSWLGAVCLLWLGLVVVAPSFGWCAVVPGLRRAAGAALPRRGRGRRRARRRGVVDVAAADRPGPHRRRGPVCLAVLAVGAYRALERDAEVQRAVLADLRSAQDELAAAERREGALAERHRLSREIHDSVGQDLSSIVLLLQASDQDWDLRPGAAREHVRQAAASARAGLAEVRRVVHDLGPEAVRGEPLEQVLRQLAERATRGSGLPVRVQVSGAEVPLPSDVETALLRTARARWPTSSSTLGRRRRSSRSPTSTTASASTCATTVRGCRGCGRPRAHRRPDRARAGTVGDPRPRRRAGRLARRREHARQRHGPRGDAADLGRGPHVTPSTPRCFGWCSWTTTPSCAPACARARGPARPRGGREADSAAEAERVVERTRPDVVLMDLALGDGPGGARATAALRARPDPPQVLVLTTYQTDADVLAALDAGARGFLLKDAPPAELFRAVRHVADGSMVLAPASRRGWRPARALRRPCSHRGRSRSSACSSRGCPTGTWPVGCS